MSLENIVELIFWNQETQWRWYAE